MSGLFGATTIPGNRLTDIAATTSSVDIPLPFGYGKFPVDGNIIWTAGRPVEHVTKKKQGKGGVKTQEYTYTLSYAIAFCAGPIYGYLTIMRQGKVVFTTDPNATIEDKEFAAKWAQKCTMYFGTRTQMPDSTIEAVEGAGRVSAFRDLAYIVVENDDVTDNGGGVPQYQAVVIGKGPSRVTTPPYALESVSTFESDLTSVSVKVTETVGKMGAFATDFGITALEVRDMRVAQSVDLGAPYVPDLLVTGLEMKTTRVAQSVNLGAPFIPDFSMTGLTVVTGRVVLDKVQVPAFTSDFTFAGVTVV